MKYTKFFRILSIAAILSLLMMVIPATPALAASVNLSPDKGEIGDTITVTGTNFIASTDSPAVEKRVNIYFAADEAAIGQLINTNVNTYELLKNIVVGYVGDADEGEFNTTFKVPTELNDGTDDEDVEQGVYYIYVTYYGSTYIRSVEEFTVIGGEITIDLDEGPVGTEVEISGEDFGDEEDIAIEYDGDDIDIESGDDETNSRGDFETIILIPESTAGDHTITVIGKDSDTEAEATFTVEPEITTSPASGGVGTTVTVSGTGFASRSEITVFLDNLEVATDETNRDGSFEASFNVPTIEPDTYDLEVWDEDDNSDEVDFTIAATASLAPTTGAIGTEITATGAGYTAGGTITIKYDTTEVATAIVDTTGTFSTTFKVPTSQHGDHSITVSDGAITKQFVFTIESEAPPIPTPLLPEIGIKVEQPVHFDWKGVTDDSSPVTYSLQIATSKDFAALSIVLEKEGLTESEYTLTKAEELEPVGEEEPYYWRTRAIDAADNEGEWTGAGSFYTGSTFALPTWVIYSLFGLGALLLGVFGFWLGRRTVYYSY